MPAVTVRFHELAERLGMTVRDIRQRMDAAEIASWAEYDEYRAEQAREAALRAELEAAAQQGAATPPRR